MTSIKWKRQMRKVQGKNLGIFSSSSSTVENDAELVANENSVKSPPPKRPKNAASVEDSASKGERLKLEGIFLAENNRNLQALSHLKEASQFLREDAKIYEMISQIEQKLDDFYSAVISAEKAVFLSPTWAVAHQTLGRARMNVGDVKLARISFCKAAWIDPSLDELQEDFEWYTSALCALKLIL